MLRRERISWNELLKSRGNSYHNLTIHLCLLADGLKKPYKISEAKSRGI